jgi:3-hydroxyacyl-[acyl-carrier-protein] dehydratase
MRFFLIDKITRWDVPHSAEAVKNVALSEDYFDDHFPRRPIMPGVLMIEGMAQLAGLLLEEALRQKHGRNAKALLSVLERTKFREMVRPGDQLTYRAEITSLSQAGGKATAQALCDDRPAVTSGMVFVFQTVDDPLLEVKRAELMRIWMSPGQHE